MLWKASEEFKLGTEEILWLDSREGIGGMDPGAKENNYDFMVSVSGRGDDMQD